MKCLHRTGYTNVTFQGNLDTDSKRNQDLGMMERRIIVTSQASKEWTPVKVKKSELKNVVVIMGDPEKPDIVKPSGGFDQERYGHHQASENCTEQSDGIQVYLSFQSYYFAQ